MKVLAGFVLIFLLLELQSDNCAALDNVFVQNNIRIGEPVEGEKVLKELNVRHEPGEKFLFFFNVKVDETVAISSQELQNKTITRIALYQNDEPEFEASNASIEILEGGINKKNVTFKLTSDRGYGFNYKALIYGI